MMLVILNILTLSTIAIISMVTIFYEGYKDSMAERIGASLIGIWAYAQLAVWWEINPAQLLLQVGLVCRGIAILFRAFKGRPGVALAALNDLNDLLHRK